MASRNETEDFLESLRSVLREIRLDSGMTQVELAKKVEGLQQSAIARVESGRSPNVGIRTLYEIAKASATPLSEIIRKVEGNPAWRDENDEWSAVCKKVGTLSSKKRKWIAKVLNDILSDATDN